MKPPLTAARPSRNRILIRRKPMKAPRALFGGDGVELDAAIARAPGLGGVVGDRMARAITLGAQASRRDAATDECRAHRRGACIAQALVHAPAPDGVGVALDADLAGTGFHLVRQAVEQGVALGIDFGAASGELDLLAGQESGKRALATLT